MVFWVPENLHSLSGHWLYFYQCLFRLQTCHHGHMACCRSSTLTPTARWRCSFTVAWEHPFPKPRSSVPQGYLQLPAFLLHRLWVLCDHSVLKVRQENSPSKTKINTRRMQCMQLQREQLNATDTGCPLGACVPSSQGSADSHSCSSWPWIAESSSPFEAVSWSITVFCA